MGGGLACRAQRRPLVALLGRQAGPEYLTAAAGPASELLFAAPVGVCQYYVHNYTCTPSALPYTVIKTGKPVIGEEQKMELGTETQAEFQTVFL
jgi:hypothetical protein